MTLTLHLKRVIAAAAALVVAGCVAHLQADLPEQTSFPTVAAVGNGTAVTVVKPTDSRQQRDLIGVLKNDQGSIAHEVRANQDPVIWIGNSFSSGLKQAASTCSRSTD